MPRPNIEAIHACAEGCPSGHHTVIKCVADTQPKMTNMSYLEEMCAQACPGGQRGILKCTSVRKENIFVDPGLLTTSTMTPLNITSPTTNLSHAVTDVLIENHDNNRMALALIGVGVAILAILGIIFVHYHHKKRSALSRNAANAHHSLPITNQDEQGFELFEYKKGSKSAEKMTDSNIFKEDPNPLPESSHSRLVP